jgi:capsular exopolysaccharide synthesis family protein
MAAELETLHEQREQSRKEYRALSLLRADYMKLATQRDKLRENVDEAETFIRKLNVLHDDTTAIKVQLGSIAVPPDRMVSPKILVFIPGGFVLGFMVGIGLAFLIELLNDLLRTPSDVMKHLRIPLLGTICHKDEDRSVRRVDLFHVVQQAPYSILSECYRQLRINLKLSDSGGRNKSLLVTSGAMGDGKTTVAVNLCYTLVADDRRVVLVDTNFRKPSTQAIFPKDGEDKSTSGGSGSGLSNYLMGQCDIAEAVRTSGIENLDVIDSGLMPLNTAELLGSDKMKNLIANLSKQYDYVIIDGPPLLISEAKILADETDGTIVVFNTAATRRGAAQRTLRELREINVNLVGTVLVGVRSMKGGYFEEVNRSYQEYQHSAKKHASLPA